ncbi:TetR/AcrR family transcriptional regulator [Variovorax sp. HJSM1_2]|uniref:TetR/AcrR family transcriptional regulator n=1 Tax=Variovorax sp. HJSM1_2 TaxID=3366263 RepID=UPI003BDBB4D8
MSPKTVPRPGGRSARVQAAVHQASRELTQEIGRAALTVPLIAARAGVTPSTIYRRWGDLAELLADVALDRMRADTEPADTGTVLGDLVAWSEQYLDEMSSEIGKAMLRDVLAGSSQAEMPVPCQCAAYTASQIAVILERGVARGQAVPEVDAVMDGVVAPIIYRTLFGPFQTSHAHVHALVDACMKGAQEKAVV